MPLHAPHSAGQMAVMLKSPVERLQLVRATNARHSVGSSCEHDNNVVGTCLVVLVVLRVLAGFVVVLVAVVVVVGVVVVDVRVVVVARVTTMSSTYAALQSSGEVGLEASNMSRTGDVSNDAIPVFFYGDWSGGRRFCKICQHIIEFYQHNITLYKIIKVQTQTQATRKLGQKIAEI